MMDNLKTPLRFKVKNKILHTMLEGENEYTPLCNCDNTSEELDINIQVKLYYESLENRINFQEYQNIRDSIKKIVSVGKPNSGIIILKGYKSDSDISYKFKERITLLKKDYQVDASVLENNIYAKVKEVLTKNEVFFDKNPEYNKIEIIYYIFKNTESETNTFRTNYTLRPKVIVLPHIPKTTTSNVIDEIFSPNINFPHEDITVTYNDQNKMFDYIENVTISISDTIEETYPLVVKYFTKDEYNHEDDNNVYGEHDVKILDKSLGVNKRTFNFKNIITGVENKDSLNETMPVINLKNNIKVSNITMMPIFSFNKSWDVIDSISAYSYTEYKKRNFKIFNFTLFNILDYFYYSEKEMPFIDYVGTGIDYIFPTDLTDNLNKTLDSNYQESTVTIYSSEADNVDRNIISEFQYFNFNNHTSNLTLNLLRKDGVYMNTDTDPNNFKIKLIIHYTNSSNERLTSELEIDNDYMNTNSHSYIVYENVFRVTGSDSKYNGEWDLVSLNIPTPRGRISKIDMSYISLKPTDRLTEIYASL